MTPSDMIRTLIADESFNAANAVPFHLLVGGESFADTVGRYKIADNRSPSADDTVHRTVVYDNPATGLRVSWIRTPHPSHNAVYWRCELENIAAQPTPLIEDVRVLNIALAGRTFRIQAIQGGHRNPTMFEPQVTDLLDGHHKVIGSAAGRSSTLYAPYASVVSDAGSAVLAVEWSGTWVMTFQRAGDTLACSAAMPGTHFVLHPGERVRTPGILLVMRDDPDIDRAHTAFRRLVYAHYVPRRNGDDPIPTVFCNTCFTRGGGWLDETTEANQIALIRAYADLGAEAVITDAGWFNGWSEGFFRNWQPRPDHYPRGMAPVARAAEDAGIVYGLWFEPEKAGDRSDMYIDHPEWFLSSPDSDEFCLNLGLPEARQALIDMIAQYMALPGFSVYRQDLNFDPLRFWRPADAPDRRGITEMKYITGLYAFWDRIRATWPDCLMEGCSGGGHRMDLGAIMRMDVHQKSDYWFDNEADQTSLYALSRYLPNNTFVAHLRDLDEYAFHSLLPSSLCLGWIADANDFDVARGRKRIAAYKAIRHLLVGDWYPLTPPCYDYYDINRQVLDLAALPQPGADTPADHPPLRITLNAGGPCNPGVTLRITARMMDSPVECIRETDCGDQSVPNGQALMYLNAWAIEPNHTRAYTTWIGSQYHRDDLQEGLILMIRRPDSPYCEIQVHPKSLTPDATYRLEDSRTGQVWTQTGRAVMDGLTVRLPEKRQSTLIRYRQIADEHGVCNRPGPETPRS